ncbi:MAG: septum formation initiator family protein [Chloroflexota bacterium]|nr:septum formation initiator family protein [Chloroflexota bacterium]
MKNPPEQFWLLRISWLIWGLLGVLLILLFSVFSRAWALRQELQQQETLLHPLLTAEANQHATLEARLEYVQSAAYVEEWARTRAKMTRPGEVLVMPLLPTPTATLLPTPTATPAATPTPAPFWQRWWQSLRGESR